MRSIHQTRVVKGQQLLEMSDSYLDKGKANFLAIAGHSGAMDHLIQEGNKSIPQNFDQAK